MTRPATPPPSLAPPSRSLFISLFLLVLCFWALVPAHPADAFQKHALEDVVVQRGQTVPEASSMAGDITVDGGVSGNVRSGAGDIEVNGPVGGNVESGMGDITINKSVGGNVSAGAGDVDIDNRVGGNVNVGHGDLHLGPRAVVSGNLSYDGNLSEERGAVVRGEKVGDRVSGFDPVSGGGMARVLGLAGWALTTFVYIACSVLAAVLTPRQLSSAARNIEVSPGRSLLFGVASVPAVIVLAAVFGVSIVGIPVLLLLVPAYLGFVFFGALVAAFSLGRRILFATGSYRGGNALAAVVGAVAISVAYLVPFVGSVVFSLLALLGTGSTILALLSWRRARPEYAPPYYEPRSDPRHDG